MISATISLDKRYLLANKKHAVKILVNFQTELDGKKKYNHKYYPTGEELFIEEFNKLYTAKALQETLNKLLKLLSKANTIIEKNPYISIDEFDLLFTSKGNYESVQGIFDFMISQAENEGRISTRNSYRDTKSSLNKFALTLKTNAILLGQLTPELLKRYEDFLIDQGLSYNTVGLYTRNIRTLVNLCIDKLHLLTREQYPFGRNKYVTPSATARKMALNEAQKNLLITHVPQDKKQKMFLDFWKLSFYCYGLNFTDIVNLRWKNIEDEMGSKVIRIYRTKVFRKKRVKEKLAIGYNDAIHEIIREHGNISLDPEAYIFDVLKVGMTPEQQKYKINDFIKHANEALKEITKDLGLPKVTTYTARHTFAFIMKKKGVDIGTIQKMMGHEDQKTTVKYGDTLEIDDQLQAAKFLFA